MPEQTDKEMGMSDYMKQGMVVAGMVVGTVDEIFNIKNEHIDETNKMITAVDWLHNQWANEKEWSWEKIESWFKQAKQMEMMQIVKAYHRGLFGSMEEKPIVFADEYYNETYKK